MITKEEIYKKMCAYYANDETQLTKFKKFYAKYSDFGNFETIFIDEYKSVYTQFKDEYEAIFDKYRIKEESIKEGKTVTSSIPTEVQNDPNYALLREMAKDVKKTSQWMQFVGIVVLIGVVLSVITGIVTALD